MGDQAPQPHRDNLPALEHSLHALAHPLGRAVDEGLAGAHVATLILAALVLAHHPKVQVGNAVGLGLVGAALLGVRGRT